LRFTANANAAVATFSLTSAGRIAGAVFASATAAGATFSAPTPVVQSAALSDVVPAWVERQEHARRQARLRKHARRSRVQESADFLGIGVTLEPSTRAAEQTLVVALWIDGSALVAGSFVQDRPTALGLDSVAEIGVRRWESRTIEPQATAVALGGVQSAGEYAFRTFEDERKRDIEDLKDLIWLDGIGEDVIAALVEHILED
jgi:hypothetical protein